MTESKILGDARRGRNVGRRKTGDVPSPRFGGTDRNSTRISRSSRSCGIRKEDDSWPAPVARNRASICPPVAPVGRQGLTSCSAINRAAVVASSYSFSFPSSLQLHLFHRLRSISIRIGDFGSLGTRFHSKCRGIRIVLQFYPPGHFFPHFSFLNYGMTSLVQGFRDT